MQTICIFLLTNDRYLCVCVCCAKKNKQWGRENLGYAGNIIIPPSFVVEHRGVRCACERISIYQAIPMQYHNGIEIQDEWVEYPANAQPNVNTEKKYQDEEAQAATSTDSFQIFFFIFLVLAEARITLATLSKQTGEGNKRNNRWISISPATRRRRQT